MKGLRLSGWLTQPTRSVTLAAGDGEAEPPAQRLDEAAAEAGEQHCRAGQGEQREPAAGDEVADP